MPNPKRFIGSSNAIARVLKTFSKFSLTGNKQTYSICSIYKEQVRTWSDLCFKLDARRQSWNEQNSRWRYKGRKARLEERSWENRLKMAGKAGGRGSPVKNPKKMKTKQEQDDDDWLDDLVLDTDPDKWQTSYSNLEPGGFVTKGADRKSRLDQRHARIAAATGEQDDDNDDEDETEQERLECEAKNCPVN